jgi:hypothetical protein
MAPEDTNPAAHPGGNHDRKGRGKAHTRIKQHQVPAQKITGANICGPEDLPKEVICNYPGWEVYLEQYPMVHSLQREDFPEHGVSFVYLAHFYRTKNTADESCLAQKEFEAFFLKIGYEYDYSGNFESRWFEGIGVKID